MGLLSRFRREPNEPSTAGVMQDQTSTTDVEFNKQDAGPLHIFNWRVIYMGLLVSMGGFVCCTRCNFINVLILPANTL